MTRIRIAVTAIVAALVVMCAAPVNAHDYYSTNGVLSETNQWDVTRAAPFARDENDRFTP